MPRLNCSICSKEFYASPARVAASQSGKLFCSSECHRQGRIGQPTAKRKGQDVLCSNCGKSVFKSPEKLRRKGGLYCSTECYLQKRWGRKRTVEIPCSYCGKVVKRQESQLRRGGDKYHAFCSNKCQGLWRTENLTGENSPVWKGGYNYEYGGSHWKRQRRKARDRDNHTCQDCGITEQAHGHKLDVHHLIPYDMFDDPEQANDLGNLTTLCRPCHVKRHQDLDRATLEKLLAMEAD